MALQLMYQFGSLEIVGEPFSSFLYIYSIL